MEVENIPSVVRLLFHCSGARCRLVRSEAIAAVEQQQQQTRTQLIRLSVYVGAWKNEDGNNKQKWENFSAPIAQIRQTNVSTAIETYCLTVYDNFMASCAVAHHRHRRLWGLRRSRAFRADRRSVRIELCEFRRWIVLQECRLTRLPL